MKKTLQYKFTAFFKLLSWGLILRSLVITAPCNAQTGPGGVGNAGGTGGQPLNTIWLDIDQITVLNDGDDVTSWGDKSGNGNDFSVGASNAPVFRENVINGKNGVEFSSSNTSRIVRTSFGSMPTSEMTFFFILRTSDAGNGIASYATSVRDNEYLIFDASDLRTYINSNFTASGVAVNDNTWNILSHRWRNSDGQLQIHLNGTSGLNTTHQSGATITSGGTLAFGNEQDSNNGGYGQNQDFDGYMSEVILYATSLNDAQRTLVENYLSTKYNISISSDKYAFDAAYGNDMAGLGRELDGSHLSSTSANLNLSLASISAVGDYVMFGHDAGDETTLTTVSGDNFRDDATNTRRLAREWKVDFSGAFSDNVNISFDTSNVTTGRPSGEWSWALFIDQNGDGDFRDAGDSFVDLTINGSFVEASGVTLTDNATLTLGAIKREVQFSSSSSQGLENTVQFPTLTVEINYPYSDGTSVPMTYTVAAGTAEAADFNSNRTNATLSSGSATIDLNNGASVGDAAIDVVNDGLAENTQTVTVTLNTATNAAIGAQNVHTYSILDDDEPRKIDFNSATLSQAEGNSGNYTLSLQFDLTSSSALSTETDPATSVDISVTGGDAVLGDLLVSAVDAAIFDGIPPVPSSGNAAQDSTGVTSGTITFNTVSCPNGSTNTIAIEVLNIKGDALFENDETIELTLSNAQSCALGSQTTMTITLTNDDGAPTVQFSSASSNSNEGSGTLNAQVELSSVTGTDVTVTFSDAGGTPAADGSDYSVLTSSPLTISAGSTTANVEISLLNDTSEEQDEQVVITIDGSSVALGAQTTHTLTILDDDGLGDTGPGGIGDQSSQLFWVIADSITGLSDGQSVTAWDDISGNANNFSVGASFAPVYRVNSLNGHNAVEFSSSNNSRLVANPFNISTNSVSVHMVFRTNVSEFDNAMLSYAVSSDNNEYLIYNSNAVSTYINSQIDNSTVAVNDGNWKIMSHEWQSSDGNVLIHVNGSNLQDATLETGQSITSGGSLSIGGEQDAVDGGYQSNQALDGDVAEIIMFSKVMNNARRVVLENYFSAKYNVTIANDYYAGDNSGNGDYDLDVAGIGTTDGTFANSHTSAQNSSGLNLRHRNNSLDAAGEFVFVGHNALTNGVTNNEMALIPGTGQRWQRVWYIDKTGSVDTRLTFDFSDAGISVSPGADPNDYILIRRAGQTGDFSQVVTATSISGDQIIFDLADAQLTDGYFTLATTDSDTPLPVELVSYTLENQDNAVKLNWKTAAEVDNQGFILERSEQPNRGFEQVASYQSSSNLKGQGTVSQETSYEYVDYGKFKHGETYYYRLSDVDIAGNRNVLETKAITRPDAYSLEQNYPNPFNPVTTITFSLQKPGKTVLEVYNILGQKVKTLLNDELKAGTHIQRWDARGYASGVYFYRLQSGGFMQIKKMMLVK